MSKNIKLKVSNEVSILVIFIFSIFVNRSLTFDAHSLGLSMQAYSEIFPNTENILQPHRVFLPLLGYITKIHIQLINIFVTYCFLNILYKHILKFQSRTIANLLLASLSTTMVLQFHYNFGAYPDILCYFFLLLAFINKERPVSPYIFFFIALLTKETAIFTVLFFLALKNFSKMKLLLSCMLYLPIYLSLNTGSYNLEHYLTPIQSDLMYWFNQSKPFIVTGYFSSIKYLWIIVILYIFRDFRNSYPVILLILGISLQFMLGGDTTRFVSFMFLGLIFVVEKLKMDKFLFLNIFILFLNIVTAKYYVFAYGEMIIVNESRLSFLNFFEIFNEN